MNGEQFCAACIAVSPTVLAVIGWALHWNAYINLFLSLGGGVLWITFLVAWRANQ